MSLSDTSIAAGETVQVALRIENTGGGNGTFVGELLVDGEGVASKSVAVEAGASEVLVFERRFDEPGEYELAVGNRSLDTLTVTAESDDATGQHRTDIDDTDSSPIEVVGATVPVDWVRKGFETIVRATVVNTANRTANRTLTVTVDGRPVANAIVTLRPNERTVTTIEFEAVEGTVAVEGVDAGRIEVSETREQRRTGTGAAVGGAEPAGFGIGLAALVVIVGILFAAAVFLVWQRRWTARTQSRLR